jgi:hypothetical protein
MSDSKRHKQEPDPDSARHGHPAYWKFAHHNWRFWVGLILIFAAMFIYLMTEDLAWRPNPQVPQPQSGGHAIAN